MDQFVQDHLNQLGCEHLIPLFADKGYNEESYKKLTLGKLMQLLPDDEDLVLKIMCNVKSMSNPTTNAGLFPPPNMVVKTEPLEMLDADDDEVQVVNITIRAPSGFTRVEIKQERPDDIQEPLSGASAVGGQSPRPPSEAADAGGNSNLRAMSSDNSLGSPDISQTWEEERNRRRSSRVRKTIVPWDDLREFEADEDFDEAPFAKISRIDISSISERKWVHCILAEKTETQKWKFSEEVVLIYSTNDELEFGLKLLEKRSDKLSTRMVDSFELNDTSKSKQDGGISNAQIQRLANLPQAFWSELTTLVFNLSFPEDTDFNLITIILSKCIRLQYFEVRGGVLPSGNEDITLHIPKMDELISFQFGAKELLRATSYDQEYAVSIDVESDEYRSRQLSPKFKIDFGNRAYPILEALEVGSLVHLNFGCLSQFPQIQSFEPGENSESILSRLEDSVFKKLDHTLLHSSLRWSLIEESPRWFPNLSSVTLCLPNTNTICGVIRHLANLRIKYLDVLVSFEFESALITALRGLKYKLVTEKDQIKFERLKEYSRWKAFISELKIEVPDEDAELSEMDDNMDQEGLITIGSFKYLNGLSIRRLPRDVYIPECDIHWKNPAVRLSTLWSSWLQLFPGCILLDELTKLKGTLRGVHLRGYEVDPVIAGMFQTLMGFKINFDPLEVDSALDVVSYADLKTEADKTDVKQESET